MDITIDLADLVSKNLDVQRQLTGDMVRNRGSGPPYVALVTVHPSGDITEHFFDALGVPRFKVLGRLRQSYPSAVGTRED
jgi:hypothetical protein